MESSSSLKMSGISKRFGTVIALNAVSVSFEPGEVHAVVGENGSGKSTLLGIACGVISPDEGSVEIGGHSGRTSAKRSRRLGVGSVFQTQSLVRDLSVADNLYASIEAWLEGIGYSHRLRWASDQLAEFGLDVDPGALVSELGLGQKQMLEIAKSYLARPRILLLDEPTTALGPAEIDALHGLVRELAEGGGTVVYVSHRLPEVLSVASRVTVMRDGVSQGTYRTAAVTEDDLVSMMVGPSGVSDAPIAAEEKAPSSTGGKAGTALVVEDLAGVGFGPIDLALRQGEIVGIAGAEGNGQREFLESLAGLRRSVGTLSGPDGSNVSIKRPRDCLAAGIMYLSGDRRGSLTGVLGLRANTTAASLGMFHTGGIMRPRREHAAVSRLMARLRVRTPSLDQPVRLLSGGNQQKVLLGRQLLAPRYRVLVVEEPTQGVDVQSRADIYAALREQARHGTGIIVGSSDLTELSTLCDRVLVLSRGRVVRELAHDALDERTMIEAVVGAGSPSANGHVLAHKAEDRAEADSAGSAQAKIASKLHRVLRSISANRWQLMPVAFLALLTLALGGYTADHSPSFLTELNTRNLLLSTIPLALIALAQSNALMVAGFDMSVGFTATFALIIGSFVLDTNSVLSLIGGSIAIVVCGVAIGIVNGALVARVRLPPIIATIATMSVLEGAALLLRPVPGGAINSDLADALNTDVAGVPLAFIGIAVLAIVFDIVLYGTRHGLLTRFVGLDAESAGRIGIRVGRVQLRAYVLTSILHADRELIYESRV